MAINRINNFESSITLSDGELYLETSENPIAIDIRFKGLIVVESNLPEGFFISENNRRMIILRLCQAEMPKSLFRYNGTFEIQRARVYTEEKSSTATINVNLNTWERMDKLYSGYNSEWKNYLEDRTFFGLDDKTYKTSFVKRLLRGNKSVVINRNFGSNLKGFYLNKEEYKGDVIYDSRGLFYTPDKQMLKIKLNKNKLKSLINRKGRR